MAPDRRWLFSAVLIVVSGANIKSAEDTIPIIEIRGEGKPMTSAQIRALEEEAEGKPLDVKINFLRSVKDCPYRSKRMDFVTFHYRGFLENGRSFGSSYRDAGEPVRVQLQVGQMIAGLDKALDGVCTDEELKVNVPWRLAQRRPAKKWRRFPKEEHWIIIELSVVKIEPWSAELQFKELDDNQDGYITAADLVRTQQREADEFGKALTGFGIDADEMAAYFIHYFDADSDGRVSLEKYKAKMGSDMKAMDKVKSPKPRGQPRDPGIGWILDFNGDGVVDYDELTEANEIFHSHKERKVNVNEL